MLKASGGRRYSTESFPVEVLIRAVQASHSLKDAADLDKMMRLISGLIMPVDEHSDFLGKLNTGEIRFPRKSCIYKMRTKLDWMCMLYQRRLFDRHFDEGTRWVSHFSSDSSPQSSYEYFCSLEDRFIFFGKPDEACQAFGEKCDFSKIVTWTRRTLPVVVLGVGCQSTGAKLNKLLHVLSLETNPGELKLWTGICRSWLADQGVELGLGDAPDPSANVAEITSSIRQGAASWSDQKVHYAHAFPLCMSTADSLHATFNALQDALCTSEAWPRFEPIFRDLVTFFGDKKLRDRFLAVCMAGASCRDKAVFEHFEGSRFEWRFWGNLEHQTFQLSNLWEALERYWDMDAMTKGGSIESSHMRLVNWAVENKPGDLVGVHAMLAAASAISQAVGFIARWLRGCRCHSQLFDDSPYKQRRRFMKEMEEGDDVICMWAGRNAPSLALGEVDTFCRIVQEADTDLLRMVLAKSSEPVRIVVIRFMTHAKSRLCEQLRSKFAFWQQLPHSLCGLFGSYFDHDLSSCTALAKQIFQEITEGENRSKMHRVMNFALNDERLMARRTVGASCGGAPNAPGMSEAGEGCSGLASSRIAGFACPRV